jgi:hypothetical protein
MLIDKNKKSRGVNSGFVIIVVDILIPTWRVANVSVVLQVYNKDDH